MKKHHLYAATVAAVCALALAHPRAAADSSSLGYYRFPAIHGDLVRLELRRRIAGLRVHLSTAHRHQQD